MKQQSFRIQCSSLTPEFLALVNEYLPDSSIEKLKRYYRQYSNAFLGAYLDSQLIGVAFGWARKEVVPEDDSFTLDGIAIREAYQKHGYGTKLLQAFHQAVSTSYGFREIGVGSAGGYVEHFYISNGYIPSEYKYYDETLGILVETRFHSLPEYEAYERKHENGFVVMKRTFL